VVASVTDSGSGQQQRARLSKTQQLRALLKRPGVIMAPEGYTVISARLAEAHGFEVIYIPGSMMSGTYLGVPDWGLISPTAMVDIAGRIAREISIPAISDADHGGDTALNVFHTVQQFERAGIAGIHLEDTINPKHADQRARGAGQPVAPPALDTLERMVLRVQAAAQARSDPDFIIIARTDEQEIDGMLRRGAAFAKAGADVFMPRAIRPDQIDRVTREVGLPILGVNLPMRDVKATQLKINVYAGLVSQPAIALCDSLLRELKDKEEIANRPGLRLSQETAARLTNQSTYATLAEQWTRTL
jgi:2-methylisocitrate lyase-like PEP mutase family enzyme